MTETRPVPFVDSSYGERIVTGQRLKTIAVGQGARTVRKFELGYRSRLLFSVPTSVQMK